MFEQTTARGTLSQVYAVEGSRLRLDAVHANGHRSAMVYDSPVPGPKANPSP